MTARDDIAAARVTPEQYAAAYAAVYTTLDDLAVEWTAHKPVQGEAMPKVLAYRVAAAVLALLPADPDVTPGEIRANLIRANLGDLPADPDETGAECARCEDAEGGYRVAREAADRFRDVLADCLSHGDENPGDDVLVTKVREHFGRTGPEPRRWRDFMTGAEAMRDQINAAAKDRL